MRRIIVTAILATLATSAASQAQQAAPPVAKPAPLPPLPNPPGDIPDNQALVDYRSPIGFAIKTPEGWARRERPDGVTFADKYGAVAVAVTTAPVAPTVASATGTEAAALEALPVAVVVAKVAPATLPGGAAVVIGYASNSEPNAVTGKAIRLENERYLFWRAGRLATVTLSAPFGADNVDQWQLIAGSFRWN